MIFALTVLAGGLGSSVRLALDGLLKDALRPWIHERSGIGLVVVNITGSFALGLLTAASGDTLTTVLGTGFLGGYTTFSTASLDSARLALSGRGLQAVTHGAGTAAACIAAAVLGMWVG